MNASITLVVTLAMMVICASPFAIAAPMPQGESHLRISSLVLIDQTNNIVFFFNMGSAPIPIAPTLTSARGSLVAVALPVGLPIAVAAAAPAAPSLPVG